MSVKLICVGKLRERFFVDAADEYLKRLSRLMPVTVVELADEREPSAPSPTLNAAVL
ncbi:MAG: 23S rRNA (pseudouridine(1915)-N(3))-methyltransferase RlmH, partial [Clostridia bacterium]